jgi:hypothetical protein
MSIDFVLRAETPTAKRPSAETLMTFLGIIHGMQGSFPSYRFHGAEVDVAPELTTIFVHMHSSQSQDEREKCFDLMAFLLKRLGWTDCSP